MIGTFDIIRHDVERDLYIIKLISVDKEETDEQTS